MSATSTVDQRFDLAETTVAVMRLIQTHDLDFISVATDDSDHEVSVHVYAPHYPAWVEATRDYRDVRMELTDDHKKFRTYAIVDIDGHTVELLTYLPIDSFIPAAEQAVA